MFALVGINMLEQGDSPSTFILIGLMVKHLVASLSNQIRRCSVFMSDLTPTLFARTYLDDIACGLATWFYC